MAIITANRRTPTRRPAAARPAPAQPMPARRPITAARGQSITSGARSRQTPAVQSERSQRIAAAYAALTPNQQAFARQLQANCRRHASVMASANPGGATNTSNIAARPDFLELLPLFVQKLLVLDLFGSVAMKSRQQIVPYFKVMAANEKGEVERGTIFNSPFVNNQGGDGNFTGKVVKNEIIATGEGSDPTAFGGGSVYYVPVLPGSVTVRANLAGNGRQYTDAGDGTIVNDTGTVIGSIEYDTGLVSVDGIELAPGDTVAVTYQYDNETVGSDVNGDYGARMGKTMLQLDEFNLIAEAHQLASYWSIYSAFAASQEWGSNINDMAKEAAFGELTAEINTNGFRALEAAARYSPQYNWDASPVLSGSVVPSDYLNMFKLKLGQAAASIYQVTNLTRPNRISMGANVAEYMKMINGFVSEVADDTVGPYKLGRLDNFELYVEPKYDPNKWVMSCKSSDIRRNSGLFGEYMPFTSTDAIGLANMSIQQGYATMYAMKVVNPLTVVSGKITGVF